MAKLKPVKAALLFAAAAAAVVTLTCRPWMTHPIPWSLRPTV